MKRFWEQFSAWEKAEEAWDQQAQKALLEKPLKRLKVLPQIPGITDETKRFLRWKSLKYMLLHKEGPKLLFHILKHPLTYLKNYGVSLLKKGAYRRDDDFFFYNLKDQDEFVRAAQEENTLLVVGFSYCQKPHECPSKRFTPDCIADPENSVCQQCDIGKVLHALPSKRVIPLLIPTVHYIGDEIFKLKHKHPDKKIVFLITACEMTLEMFADWGNMAGLQGIGVRLDGRICNTMEAFILSEEGIKPGLTVVTSQTQKRILELVRTLRSGASA